MTDDEKKLGSKVTEENKNLKIERDLLRQAYFQLEETTKKLQQSEYEFRTMVEASPMAIYRAKGLTQVGSYLNPAFTNLFGYTLTDAPSVAEWWPRAYPDEQYRQELSSEWEKRIRRATETNTPIDTMETVVTCKDGTTKNIIWGFVSLGEDNISFGFDVTALKKTQKNLEESMKEIEKMNQFMIGRELKIIELKNEIKKLNKLLSEK